MFHGILKGRRPKVSSRFSHQSHNARRPSPRPSPRKMELQCFFGADAVTPSAKASVDLGRLGGSWPANSGFFGKTLGKAWENDGKWMKMVTSPRKYRDVHGIYSWFLMGWIAQLLTGGTHIVGSIIGEEEEPYPYIIWYHNVIGMSCGIWNHQDIERYMEWSRIDTWWLIVVAINPCCSMIHG